MPDTPSHGRYNRSVPPFTRLIPAAWIKDNRWHRRCSLRNPSLGCRLLVTLVFTVLVAGCAAYGPYHANTSGEPFNSVRGPKDGRYKLAFIEFGDQGSMVDPSQLGAALQVIGKAQRPLLFVYIHGWQNNAISGDVCRFEHFIDTMSRFPEMTARKINVIGVYIAWRGRDLTVPGLSLLTFWSRKSGGQIVAAQNGCLAGISELALAARAPDKKYHHCVLLGHSFGGLVLGSTISHSILDAGSNGVRNSIPWDMAVAFNSADSSIGSRQFIAELNYLYKYHEKRVAYVTPTSLETGVLIEENRPFLIILQSENDQATGRFFPIGTGVYNTINLRYHWDKVSVRGRHGSKVSDRKFYTQRTGTKPYLCNHHVLPLAEGTVLPA